MVFPDNNDPDQWAVRVQRGAGRGRYLKHTWASAKEAQEAVERALAVRADIRGAEANAHTVTR